MQMIAMHFKTVNLIELKQFPESQLADCVVFNLNNVILIKKSALNSSQASNYDTLVPQSTISCSLGAFCFRNVPVP